MNGAALFRWVVERTLEIVVAGLLLVGCLLMAALLIVGSLLWVSECTR